MDDSVNPAKPMYLLVYTHFPLPLDKRAKGVAKSRPMPDQTIRLLYNNAKQLEQFRIEIVASRRAKLACANLAGVATLCMAAPEHFICVYNLKGKMP